ncbi:TAXI family TRAP transporter solute-binding subunit (plasmid) [Gemmobacter fulvus]|uniref:TAXI family TRAP transporter solute-binding subunit n=1 Tax=Gemmobacter fulvus TaxID=2840474 RepID=A0A975PAB3_9RHOB|nr:TAXI family TRAP transporter solute-binding subunit [Gemmobacter fulvus]MBT9246463.1 TAXI family TRAP transporter solute-binding subunit [Gemmobacter fulvus]QWK92564.1 TAXI family TRAP transporter solute-binding subunit [Gemmobacter fulvus]
MTFRITLATAFACAIAISAPKAEAEQFINVLTGGTSGVYYPLGVALSDIYGKGIEGARTQVQATKASVENLNLIEQGKGEIAFTLGDALALAWEGNVEAGFKTPLKKLRIVAAIYPNYVQIAALQEAGVTTIADMKGKTLSVGAAKSGTELNARAILGAAGLSYDDLAKVEYLPFAESVELMKNRQLEATLQSSGLGNAAIKDLASSQAISIVSIPAEVATAMGMPYMPATIPAGTYQGQDGDVATVAVGNYLVTSEDVPEEVVYQMTRLIFENLDVLKAAHSAGADISLDKAAKNPPVPLHPGAERFYREQGKL